MLNLFNISLAKKLTFLTIVLSVITSFSILFMINFTLNHFNVSYLEDVLKSSKKTIEQVYVEPLWNFDQLQITQVSKSLMIDNGFAYITAIRITNPNGNIIFDNNASMSKAGSFQEYLKLPYTKQGSVQVTKNGVNLGKVDIVFTNSGFIEKFKAILFKFLIITSLLILVSSVWIFISFNKYLTIPLNKLLGQVHQLKNEDYSVKKYEKLPHELLLIADALNFTSMQIKKKNEDLKEYTDNLEQVIEVRTQELEQQISENVNAQRLAAVGELASGIAHEINNPLTVILGSVSKIRRQLALDVKPREDDVHDNLDKLVSMTGRISKIIKGLKNISRNGTLDTMSEFSIPPLMDELKTLTNIRTQVLGIDFTITVGPGVDQAFGREVQISQVLVNLINNSIDAIEHDQNRWVKVEVQEKQELVEFRVTDSGAGISAAILEKIMFPFFTTKDVGKGTGLGLSISKNIIEEHGGEMIYNKDCPNTQFIFTLHKADFRKA